MIRRIRGKVVRNLNSSQVFDNFLLEVSSTYESIRFDRFVFVSTRH